MLLNSTAPPPFTMNGETHNYTDAWFAENKFYREFKDNIPLSEAASHLPNMTAAGNTTGTGVIYQTAQPVIVSMEQNQYSLQMQSHDAQQIQKGDVTLAALDFAYMRTVDARVIGQGFLRQRQGHAPATDGMTQSNQISVFVSLCGNPCHAGYVAGRVPKRLRYLRP